MAASRKTAPTKSTQSAQKEPRSEKMKLTTEPLLNGIMAYWDKVEDAAIYYVHLLIGEKTAESNSNIIAGRASSITTENVVYKEIATVEAPRNILYHSFLNLAKIDQNKPYVDGNGFNLTGKPTGKNYYIYVEAEDRMGNTISKTDKVLGQVYIMVKGSFSLYNY